MKQSRAERAIEHLDRELILSAMDSSDLEGGRPSIIKGEKRMKNNMWKKWLSIAAAFVIMFSAVLVTGIVLSGRAEAVVAFDVNPSIEIEIGKNQKVKEVRALNPEAVEVLGDMDLSGTELEVAVNAIVGALVRTGYISDEQNSILVSIDSENGKHASRLKEKLVGEIGTLLRGSNITASVITQSYDSHGQAQGDVSRARSALISKIVSAGLLDANGVPYTAEALSQLKVNELKLMLESKGLTVDGIDSTGAASSKNYISAETALAAALVRAGLAQADVTRIELELDYDDDIRAMVYEVEFRHEGMKHEYEILAALDGEAVIVEEEVKAVGTDDDDAPVTLPQGAISREAALSAAYTHAAVDPAAVRRPKIETDIERGVTVYEIEFKVGNTEYEYSVNVLTGEIVEYESEPID